MIRGVRKAMRTRVHDPYLPCLLTRMDYYDVETD